VDRLGKKSLEDRIVDKIFDGVNFIISKWIKPDMKVDKVGNLNKEQIDLLKNKYGIKGVILDIDETLRKESNNIPKCNSDWIDMIKQELKVIVVSNGIDKKVERFLELKGIEYIGFAHKPLKKNFIKACTKMDLKPEEVLVVGDDLFCDIYGGNRNNMKTILVKEVEEDIER